MKKAIMSTGIACMLLGSSLANAETLNLPQPDKSSDLMKIIDARQSERAYSDKKISEQELSNILWSAFGVNSRGTRTIPTARNQQNLKVFVVYNGSVWQYDGKNNSLDKISDDDLMPYIAQQNFVRQAPVHLLYVGNDKFADAHSGSAYENVSLYAADNGLASVVRGVIDREALHKKLNLSDDEVVTYHQTIGYPAK